MIIIPDLQQGYLFFYLLMEVLGVEVLTYPLEERGGIPVYKYLYEMIKRDILQGKILPGEKLPSKRALSSHLGIAVITVENAYSLLELEGYIVTQQKRGYYVSDEMNHELVLTERKPLPVRDTVIFSDKENDKAQKLTTDKKYIADFTVSRGGADSFPFSSWAKISRKVLLDREDDFLRQPEGQGVFELREAIGEYLYKEKGISVDISNIIVGPGTEYLHHILIQLLGRNVFVGVEDPGYKKVGRIYESNGVKVIYVPVDNKGMKINSLYDSNVKLVHTSPSHHFPTGCVMPADRRQKLLAWALKQEAYVVEDDYDSEFRFDGRPISPLYSMGPDRVIYMNTFTRSLAPSIRIAYMVLPDGLMKKYREKLFFYSGTVSSFDQYTLARFIKDGYYERHIRRVRNKYKGYRDNLLWAIEESNLYEYVDVHEDKAGLHMIFEVKKNIDSEDFIKLLEKNNVKIAPLALYCYISEKFYKNKFLICYGDLGREQLLEAMNVITDVLRKQ